MKNVVKNCLEILLTFVGVGDVSFHYKSGFLRNWLRLNSVSYFSSCLSDLDDES